MTDNKRFYWLKLKENFFQQKEIKKLRKLAGGDTLTIIYQQILLLSLKNNGNLYFENFENSFAEELALEIDEEADNVKLLIAYLEHNNLIECLSENEFRLIKVPEYIGSETDSANRVRNHRLRLTALQCNGNVTKCNDM